MEIFQLLRSDGNYEWELECQFIAENMEEAEKISLSEYEIDINEKDEEGDHVFMLDTVSFSTVVLCSCCCRTKTS